MSSRVSFRRLLIGSQELSKLLPNRSMIRPPDSVSLFLMERSLEYSEEIERATSGEEESAEDDYFDAVDSFEDSSSRGASRRRLIQPPDELRSSLDKGLEDAKRQPEHGNKEGKQPNRLGLNFLAALTWSLSR